MRRLLTRFVICLLPLLLLATVNYWNGLRAVEQTLDTSLQDNVNALTGEADSRLRQNETDLTRFSLSTRIQEILNSPAAGQTERRQQEVKSSGKIVALPAELRDSFVSMFSANSHLVRLTLIDARGAQILSAERGPQAGDTPVLINSDNKVTPESRGSFNAVLSKQRSATVTENNFKITIPIVQERGQNVVGALAGETDLAGVFEDVASTLEPNAGLSNGGSMVVVLSSSGRIIYHTNHVLQGQMARDATPELRSIITQATARQGGIQKFRAPDGQDYLATLAWLPRLSLSVVLGHQPSTLVPSAHRWGIAGLVFALVVALFATFGWERYEERKSRSIERVTEDLNAIAKGELDRRIELRSSDDVRAIADNINVVTEQLRAQIAREAESRQFDSFVRLSAMLTHDLKNAIEALSLTVGNMEQHFDNEQFRADAMKSVAGATDKLKAVVARLTRPLTSLSGEHKRPSKVDLVPILKKVAAQTATSLEGRHELELKLPAPVFAVVDAQRIEAVVENLVLNAVEAMSERSGTLTIAAADLSNGKVMFSVSDTGTGISRSFIEQRLFRPFATTKRSGVGLGLYTCREIVQANGGSIEVSSEEAVGTTFRVVLPSTDIDARSKS